MASVMGIFTDMRTYLNKLPPKKVDKVQTLSVSFFRVDKPFWYIIDVQQWQGVMASNGWVFGLITLKACIYGTIFLTKNLDPEKKYTRIYKICHSPLVDKNR